MIDGNHVRAEEITFFLRTYNLYFVSLKVLVGELQDIN